MKNKDKTIKFMRKNPLRAMYTRDSSISAAMLLLSRR